MDMAMTGIIAQSVSQLPALVRPLWARQAPHHEYTDTLVHTTVILILKRILMDLCNYLQMHCCKT